MRGGERGGNSNVFFPPLSFFSPLRLLKSWKNMFVWGLGGLVAHERRAGALVSTLLLGAFHLLAAGCTACAGERPLGSAATAAAAAAPSASGTPLSRRGCIYSGGRVRRRGPSHLFSFYGRGPKQLTSRPEALNQLLPLAEVIREQIGSGNELLRRGSDSHCRALLGSSQSKRGEIVALNCLFVSSTLI